ncbi:MAG: hypothetical protein DWQ05_08635 [Calditrichaeota bacterium]|nr:MAG: hypothetical protein DWQ05_08635 [Calditrichota bacterium]
MQHTLILNPGEWHAEGRFINENEVSIPAEGTIRILHEFDAWRYESEIRIHNDQEPDIKNKYIIQPWQEGSEFLNWSAANTLMGNLRGKFLLVAETIISQFYSEEGDYVGSEVMLMQNDKSYYSRGITFVGDHKLSSWGLNLTQKF